MSKKKITENHYEEDQPVVKKKRKHNIFAFAICLLLALMIWVYAVNMENRRNDASQTVSVASISMVAPDDASL